MPTAAPSRASPRSRHPDHPAEAEAGSQRRPAHGIEAGPRWDRRFIRRPAACSSGLIPCRRRRALMLLDENARDAWKPSPAGGSHRPGRGIGLGNARLENIDLVKIDLG